jgi:carbon monoxide dehydrogenase subunit G
MKPGGLIFALFALPSERPFMSRQSASTVIDREPQEVFDYMDDISREREWQPSLQSAEQHPPGPSRVGTKKRYVSEFLGRELRNTYVVVEVEQGRRLVCETTRDSAVNARTEVTCEPSGNGTKLTMVIDGKPRGFMKLMPATVLEATYRKELTSALARLKGLLEKRA